MAHGTPIPSAEAIAKVMAANRSATRGPFTKVPEVAGDPPKMPSSRQAPATDAQARMTPSQKRWTIETLLDRHGIHPVEELILMVKDWKSNGLTNDQRIKILTELAAYTTPKVKTIEVSGQIDHQMTVNIVKFADVKRIAEGRVMDAEVVGEVSRG